MLKWLKDFCDFVIPPPKPVTEESVEALKNRASQAEKHAILVEETVRARKRIREAQAKEKEALKELKS